MATDWSLWIGLDASVGLVLAGAGLLIRSYAKEVKMVKATAKAAILLVGTALLGRPIVGVFQLRRGEGLAVYGEAV